jgi:hypothetical protein
VTVRVTVGIQVGQARAGGITAILRHHRGHTNLEAFATAINDLTFPEMRLKDHMDRIKAALQDGDRERAVLEFKSAVEDCLSEASMQARGAGVYNLKFAQVGI